MPEQPRLRLVDEDGVVQDGCPSCSALEDQVKGLERDLRSWRARYADLFRDKEADAKKSKHWPKALELFQHWQAVCNHPRSHFDAQRFWLVEPYLKNDGYELCKRAIDGMAHDCFTTTRRNGTRKRHDGWELIFRDRGKFEEACNRAPKDWKP
jgi:hypothetical protein